MQINVAIAGATGHLGPNVVRAFLDPAVHPTQIKRVTIFTRNASSTVAKSLESLGAEVIEGEPTVETLKDINVLVNLVNDFLPVDTRNAYARAAVNAGVSVYFPNEFAADPLTLDLTHFMYTAKLDHAKAAREIGAGKMKVISVRSGQFLEYLFGAGAKVGLDTENRIYTATGDPFMKVSVTSTADVGSTLVRLSVLAIENGEALPDNVRVSGNAVSIAELANIVGKERGEIIEVKTVDAAENKQRIIDNQMDFVSLVKYVLGSGVMDFSTDNQNDLVNPNEAFWKWKTVSDAVRENKGVYQPSNSI